MNPKNDFKAFSINNNANVVSQEEYEVNQSLQTGFSPDNVPTHLLNKVLRQASMVSSAVADFIAVRSGNDVLDDGNTTKLTAQLNKALEQKITTDIPSASLTQKGVVQLTNVIGNSDTLVVTQKLVQEVINSLREYTREEIDNRIKTANEIPVGSPIPWPLPYPPIGYLTCNGAFFNKLQYPKLAEVYPDGRLPDLRGEFIRGWDDGRGVDPSRSLLSWQEGSYLVQEIYAPGDNILTFSLNDRGKLKWDVPESSNISTRVKWIEKTHLGEASKDYIGVSRPRNIAFNYVVKAGIIVTQESILDSEIAILGEDRLATQAGWIKVYHVNPYSREFAGTNFEYVAKGVGLSARSYPDAPDFSDSDDMAICRSEDGKCWEIVPDHRGKIVYNKQTRAQLEIIELGELPEILTFKKPDTDYDRWDGKEWMVDKDLLKSHQIEEAKRKKAELLRQANETLSLLQDAVDIGMATEAEKSALLEWKKYRVLLTRVDVLQAPDIEWPEVPK